MQLLIAKPLKPNSQLFVTATDCLILFYSQTQAFTLEVGSQWAPSELPVGSKWAPLQVGSNWALYMISCLIVVAAGASGVQRLGERLAGEADPGPPHQRGHHSRSVHPTATGNRITQ